MALKIIGTILVVLGCVGVRWWFRAVTQENFQAGSVLETLCAATFVVLGVVGVMLLL